MRQYPGIPLLIASAALGLSGCTIRGEFSTPNKSGPETQHKIMVFSFIEGVPSGRHELTFGVDLKSSTPGKDDQVARSGEVIIPLP